MTIEQGTLLSSGKNLHRDFSAWSAENPEVSFKLAADSNPAGGQLSAGNFYLQVYYHEVQWRTPCCRRPFRTTAKEPSVIHCGCGNTWALPEDAANGLIYTFSDGTLLRDWLLSRLKYFYEDWLAILLSQEISSRIVRWLDWMDGD